MNRYYVEVKHPWNKDFVSLYMYAYSPQHIKDIIEVEKQNVKTTNIRAAMGMYEDLSNENYTFKILSHSRKKIIRLNIKKTNN